MPFVLVLVLVLVLDIPPTAILTDGSDARGMKPRMNRASRMNRANRICRICRIIRFYRFHRKVHEAANNKVHPSGAFQPPIFSFRQSVGTRCGDEAYPTKRGDKVRGQSVSAKHPTPNPLLNYSYSTRLLLAGFIGSFSLHRSSVSGDRSSLCQG